MNEPTIPDYLADYELFMDTYKKTGVVSGEEVGQLVARMASYYSRYNIKYTSALQAYSTVVSEKESSSDENTGKPLSSSKAKALADATPQAAEYNQARVHVQNIEQCINALKALQRGVLNEYSHAAL